MLNEARKLGFAGPSLETLRAAVGDLVEDGRVSRGRAIQG